MRDLIASCYNDHAVKVSDSSCSGTGAHATSAAKDYPSVQRSVTCFYRTKLSTRGVYLVSVTWSNNNLAGQGFSLAVDEGDLILRSSPPQRTVPHMEPVQHDATGAAATSLQLIIRKKKGISRSHVSGDSVVEVYWDISSARYETGPEPVGGFYVAVVVDGELGLRLGDMISDVAHVDTPPGTADLFSMIGRREQVVGRSVYCTRSRLGDGGRDHEIQIQCCRGEGRDARESELCVCVDQKKVVHVRRLRWNFRGNQTIFVDGVAVDMMWDVHDWWFSDAAPGCAAFMFRTRGTLESRPLWLEETAPASKHEQQGGGKSFGFSLLIHAFKTPWR